MSQKMMKYCKALYVGAVAFLCVWALVFPPGAHAQPPGPRVLTPHNPQHNQHRHKGFYPKPGVRINVLPGEYRTLRLGPLTYFFLEGVFYRPGVNGYVVVPAPVGARIAYLPTEAVSVTQGDTTYYTYAGVYYQRVTGGYMVVQEPTMQITPEIETKPDAAIAWEGDQIRVTAALLNVRSGPGKEHAILGQVKRGDLLEVQASSSEWYYVRIGDKTMGWVMIKYTTEVKSQPVG